MTNGRGRGPESAATMAYRILRMHHLRDRRVALR